ncbi:hypothetical protein AB0E01_22995 [Nocardia vinacea]|uniref:hypothetical protein n=1 Tax=Nocardia vinacea TaxID=96468 RepID=UPI0033F34C8C
MSVLTLSDLVSLSAIFEAAQAGKRVAFLNELGERADGTARCLDLSDGYGRRVDDDGGPVDIRDWFLRVTMDAGGVERFEPVRELMKRLHESFFVLV